MDKYTVKQTLGDGTFGTVLKGILKRTGESVAIKKMKQPYRTWDECVRLPEIVALKKLHNHPNIIRLREVIREQNTLYFVFDFMDGDLLSIIKQNKISGVAHPRVRSFTLQILQSLQHCHKNGYFHRDMKPENVLFRKEGAVEVLKLADFGLVKEVRSRPPFTDYVSTRWYRSPEILLQDRHYNSPVDIWAVGCIMVELFTARPLFPGTNEIDQLFKICAVMGSPSEATWPEGIAMGRKLRYNFPNLVPTPIAKLYPSIPAQALDLILKMLTMNPKKRITASQALEHPYFKLGDDITSVVKPPVSTAPSPGPKSQPVDWKDLTGGSQSAAGNATAARRDSNPNANTNNSPFAPFPSSSGQNNNSSTKPTSVLSGHSHGGPTTGTGQSPVPVQRPPPQQSSSGTGAPLPRFPTSIAKYSPSKAINTTTTSSFGGVGSPPPLAPPKPSFFGGGANNASATNNNSNFGGTGTNTTSNWGAKPTGPTQGNNNTNTNTTTNIPSPTTMPFLSQQYRQQHQSPQSQQQQQNSSPPPTLAQLPSHHLSSGSGGNGSGSSTVSPQQQHSYAPPAAATLKQPNSNGNQPSVRDSFDDLMDSLNKIRPVVATEVPGSSSLQQPPPPPENNLPSSSEGGAQPVAFGRRAQGGNSGSNSGGTMPPAPLTLEHTNFTSPNRHGGDPTPTHLGASPNDFFASSSFRTSGLDVGGGGGGATPLSKLLGNTRYRANGPKQSFASPSFARPSPKVASLLGGSPNNGGGSFGGGNTSPAPAAGQHAGRGPL